MDIKIGLISSLRCLLETIGVPNLSDGQAALLGEVPLLGAMLRPWRAALLSGSPSFTFLSCMLNTVNSLLSPPPPFLAWGFSAHFLCVAKRFCVVAR